MTGFSSADERPSPEDRGHLGDHLTRFVDGELDGRDRERVLAHLAGCAGCRRELDLQRHAKATLHLAPEPTLPPGLTERLLALGEPGDPVGPRPRLMPRSRDTATLPAPRWRSRSERPGRPGHGSRGPSPYGPPTRGVSRRTARRVGALAGGTLSVTGLALGMVFLLGGTPPSEPGSPVQPPVDAFLTEHGNTVNDPFGDRSLLLVVTPKAAPSASASPITPADRPLVGTR